MLEALERADSHSLRARGIALRYGDTAKETLGIDLDDKAIHEAMLLLSDVNYVSFKELPEGTSGSILTDVEVLGRGKQALGEWPRFEILITPSTLARLLDKLAEQPNLDEEQRGILRRAAEYLRTLPLTLTQAASVQAGIQLARIPFGLE